MSVLTVLKTIEEICVDLDGVQNYELPQQKSLEAQNYINLSQNLILGFHKEDVSFVSKSSSSDLIEMIDNHFEAFLRRNLGEILKGLLSAVMKNNEEDFVKQFNSLIDGVLDLNSDIQRLDRLNEKLKKKKGDEVVAVDDSRVSVLEGEMEEMKRERDEAKREVEELRDELAKLKANQQRRPSRKAPKRASMEESTEGVDQVDGAERSEEDQGKEEEEENQEEEEEEEEEDLDVTGLLWDCCKHGEISTFMQILNTLSPEILTETNSTGFTALHQCVYSQKVDFVEYLLHNPTLVSYLQPNQKGCRGWTALHLAAMVGNDDLVYMLLTTDHFKVDPNIEDDTGQTAMEQATTNGHRGTAELIQKLILSGGNPALFDEDHEEEVEGDEFIPSTIGTSLPSIDEEGDEEETEHGVGVDFGHEYEDEDEQMLMTIDLPPDPAFEISRIVYIELGTSSFRVSVFNNDMQFHFNLCQEVPPIVARSPRRDPRELMRSASSFSGSQFDAFREYGKFVGKDGWTSCFEHPDRELRAALTCNIPISSSGIGDEDGLKDLLAECLRIANVEAPGQLKDLIDDEDGDLPIVESEEVVVICPMKLGYSMFDSAKVMDVLFDLGVAGVDCRSEFSLVSIGMQQDNCIVLDIGESAMTAVAIEEGIRLPETLTTSPVGGQHLTAMLWFLLSAAHLESEERSQFSQQMKRRQLLIAKEGKEKMCFVAEDYDQACEHWGSVTLPDPTKGKKGRLVQFDRLEGSKDIKHEMTFKIPSLGDLTMEMDVERFVAVEGLFDPTMLRAISGERGMNDGPMREGEEDEERPHDGYSIQELIELVHSSLSPDQQDTIGKTIVLAGKTSLLHNLPARLETELGHLGIEVDQILVAESDEEVDGFSFSSGPFRGVCCRAIHGALDSVVTHDCYTEVGDDVFHSIL